MSEILETICAWTWWSMAVLSISAVCYEFHTLSDKYVRKMARRNMMDENGQYYFDFMKKYL